MPDLSLGLPWHTAVTSAHVADETGLVAHVQAAIAAGALPAHAGELVLAWRVAQGDRDAIATFERECGPELAAAARKVDHAPAFVDEIAQLARIRLVVGDGTAPPRIATYLGTGPLRAWVAIAALRVAYNAKRAATPPAGDDVLADVLDREPDPELRHLTSLYRHEFRDALTAALAALSDRDRALLRMRFVSGLELAQIGALYRVHESTASRWIAAATLRVGDDARARLVTKLSISDDTARSVARMVKSQLDLSIARLLR